MIAKGYDVIVVNYTTYTASNGQTIDGGGDYIERNAMNMIALIQELNRRLAILGSTEQLVVAGPSMGGQITRYALAYMEKKFAETGNAAWKHNTRLWVSLDSPHLGANIPLGAQALVYQLGYSGGRDATSRDSYNKLLGSSAAKQQLIEFYTPSMYYAALFGITDFNPKPDYLNGRTVSQGYSQNAGSAFFQQYYNNQFSNGLPGSNGYPMNLRKITLVNGSVTGKTSAVLRDGTIGNYGNPGDQALNVRAFISLAGSGSILAGATEGYNMAAYNQTGQLSRYKYKPDIQNGSFDIQPSTRNLNSRGSMDVAPGGYTTTWNDLNSGITGQSGQQVATPLVRALVGLVFAPSILLGNTVNLEPRVNYKVHSFIPTFSALGMKQPDQDWSLPLNNRNLSCTGETPFDSYFGHDDNTEHTSFDCQSVAWLLKEVDGQPQAPWYPTSVTVAGATQVCIGSTNTYTFGSNACSVPGNTAWSVDPNLQILSSTPNNITVLAAYPGTGAITATTGGKSNSLLVKVGYTPADFPITGTGGNSGTNSYTVYMPYCAGQTYTASIGGASTNLNWSLPSGWQTVSSSGNNIVFIPTNNTTGAIVAHLQDACGIAQTSSLSVYPSASGCTPVVPYVITPTPAGSYVHIYCNGQQPPCNIAGITIYSRYGSTYYSHPYSAGPQIDVPVSTWPNGTYFASINSGSQVYTLQFIVQH